MRLKAHLSVFILKIMGFSLMFGLESKSFAAPNLDLVDRCEKAFASRGQKISEASRSIISREAQNEFGVKILELMVSRKTPISSEDLITALRVQNQFGYSCVKSLCLIEGLP